MKLSRLAKSILLFANVFALVGVACIFAIFFVLPVAGLSPLPSEVFDGDHKSILETCASIAVLVLNIDITALMIFYLAHASRDPRVRHSRAYQWYILIIILNVLIFPVYWWKYVREDDSDLHDE